jgi:hypothetical protein
VNYRHQQLLALYFILAAVVATRCSDCAAAEQDKYWDLQPYRIHTMLAIDAPGDLAEQWAAELPAYLQDRAEASIGPLWQLHADMATGPLRQEALVAIDTLTTKDLPTPDSDPNGGADKEVVLTVHATPWGYELAGREYDRYVDRWGRTMRLSTRQGDSLPEQLFALLERVVSPLAQFHLDPANDRQVILQPRGASLPRAGDFPWAA